MQNKGQPSSTPAWARRLMSAVFAVAVAAPAAGAGTDPQWTLRLEREPPGRLSHALAYDTARQRVVLFGGHVDRGDTWEWDGVAWSRRASTGPSPRRWHALAYDSARQRVVLFGGWTGSTRLGDTWEWDGVSWTQRASTGPSPRYGHALAYDSARQRVVLFGGWDGNYRGDTWEWDGVAWTQRATTGPSPRRWHALAYDSARQRVVLFGGLDSSGYRGDTWEWDGVSWSLRATTGPTPRLYHALAYDAARQRVVLFGGYIGTSPYLVGDTWELPSGTAQPPGATGLLEVLEPNTPATLAVAGGIVNYDFLGGSGFGLQRTGLAADGVARLLLRWQVSGAGTVVWSVADENGSAADAGALHSPGSAGGSATMLSVPAVALSDGRRMAFAVLRAPMDFARGPGDFSRVSRDLRIQAVFTPSGGGSSVQQSRTIQLRRPPVVLLHGLWSSSDTWTWPIRSDPRFYVTNWDYSGSNAASFASNSQVAQAAAAQAVRNMRTQGFAATQVDFIGHSMGGMLGRLHVSGPAYARENNYFAGDFHKLITVDAPHAGTPLANALVTSEGQVTAAGALVAPILGCVGCGAVFDLRTTSMANIPAAVVRSHAIVGRGGSDLIEQGLLSTAPGWVQAVVEVLRFLEIIDSIFPPALQHDMMVGRLSQEGGLASGQTSLFGFSLVPPMLALHFTVTKEATIGERAIELLNKRASDPVFAQSGFPGGSGRAEPGEELDELAVPRDLPRGLVIVSPPPGAAVPSGEPVEVRVEALPGFEPVRVLIVGPEGAVQVQAAPFSGVLDLPAGVIGEITFQAIGVDADGEFFTSDPVAAVAQPAAALTGIVVQPSTVWLSEEAPDVNLVVLGMFSDGVARTITGPGFETVFQSGDVNVATVDGQGRVAAVGNGNTSILATNGAFSASTLVIVAFTPPPPPPPCPGDANGDGMVAFSDITSVLENWDADYSPATGPGDATRDGVVDFADITEVLASWGAACP